MQQLDITKLLSKWLQNLNPNTKTTKGNAATHLKLQRRWSHMDLNHACLPIMQKDLSRARKKLELLPTGVHTL